MWHVSSTAGTLWLERLQNLCDEDEPSRKAARKRPTAYPIPIHAENAMILRDRRGGGSIANHSGA
jgi:hypothetical protein